MADEATLRCSLQIRKDNLEYINSPSSFTADVTGTKGPTPGALTIPVGGKVISLNELVTPGLCVMTNIDPTNYVEYGIWDSGINVFYPLGELLPGEAYAMRLSRNLREEYSGTGTGTTSQQNFLFMKANTADCNVKVEAFEK